MKAKSIFVSLLRNDNTPLIVLLTITIVTRLILIANAPFTYYLDSYTYISKAINFVSSGTIQLGVGMPFIAFLGGFYYLFGSLSGSRLLMLLMSGLLVSVIYFFGRKMSGKIFGFIAAIVAIFEPLFLSYSIVPHNDVFAIAMGITALYLATSDTKFGYILSPFFYYIAIITRPELSLVLVVPIFLFPIFKLLKTRSVRTVTTFVLSIFVYILPLLWVFNYAQNLTRFGIIEKFTLFLTPELLKKTLAFSLSFYDESLLNQAIFSFIVVGIVLGLFSIVSNFLSFQKRGSFCLIKRKKDGNAKKVFFSDRGILAFLLSLVFILDVIAITAYGYGYVIVSGNLEVLGWLPERYLILPRVLMSFPLAYPLSLIIQKLWAELNHE